jgi:hypothetical protein
VSEIAPPRSTDAASEPVGFGAAVVSAFVAQAVGGGLVSMFWFAVPINGRSYAYASWSRYVIGWSVAACVIGAFVLPLVLRMFRYRISYGAALVALFAGVVAANVLFGFFTVNGARSPYFSVPVSSTYGAVGSILSLLLTAWIVQQSSRRSS